MNNRFRRLIACILALTFISADTAAVAEAAVRTLKLPSALQIIEEKAFYGNTSIEKIVVPDGTTEIRSKAFAASSLTEIELPDSLTFIAEDAFDGCEDFAVTVPKNCYAYERCIKLGLIEPPVEYTPVSSFNYTVVNGGIRITEYIGSEANVVIPTDINGYPVKELYVNVFLRLPHSRKRSNPVYGNEDLRKRFFEMQQFEKCCPSGRVDRNLNRDALWLFKPD